MEWGLAIANRSRRAMHDMPQADVEQFDAALVEVHADACAGDIRFNRAMELALTTMMPMRG